MKVMAKKYSTKQTVSTLQQEISCLSGRVQDQLDTGTAKMKEMKSLIDIKTMSHEEH